MKLFIKVQTFKDELLDERLSRSLKERSGYRDGCRDSDIITPPLKSTDITI